MSQNGIEVARPPNGAMVQGTAAKQGTLKTMLAKALPSLAAVAPKHLTPDRLVKIALSATSRQPQLLACSPESILRAVMQGAELGLEVGGLLGDAYLVPFKNRQSGKTEAQLIPGYRGLIRLARNSGQIASIEAHVVRENDTFDLAFGLDAKLVHRPCLKGDPGGVVLAYAIARFKDDTTQVEVMTRAELDAIRGRSQASNDGPWVTDEAEMQKKTVVKRLCKYLPLSAELARAMEMEAAHDAGHSQAIDVDVVIDEPGEDAPPAAPEPSGRASSLKAKLAPKVQAPTPEPTDDDREPGSDG